MHGNRMESLYLVGHACFGTIEADRCGGVGRSLGVRDFAGEHHSTLNGFGEHGLARLGMLIPTERFARQERVAEPFESDEGVTAAFGLGKSGA
jgi:hypothetical protein